MIYKFSYHSLCAYVVITIVLLFFLTGCPANNGNEVVAIADATATCSSPPVVEIVGNIPPQVLSGKKVNLAARATGIDLSYKWNAKKGSFSTPDDVPEVTYIAPIEEGNVSITIKVKNSCGEDSAEVEISVLKPTHTPSITPSVTSTPNNTPTFTPTSPPSPTPSYTPTPTPTPSPTFTPTRVWPTATPELARPVITFLELLPGGALTIKWTWDGTLAEDQSFAVRFWPVDDPRPEVRHSLTWTRGHEYRLAVDNDRFPQGNYMLNVAVVEGESSDEHDELVKSEDLLVDIPDIPPTLEPPQ